MKKRNLLLAAALPFFVIFPGRASEGQKRPFWHRNFAHRGLHEKDQSIPENSLRAFERAAAAGYGIELDVQLSRDGQVVVFHDDTLNRICGVDARVDEKTYAELLELSLAGSEEDRIPLFTEVLKLVDGRGPMIVELKSGKRNKELCEKTYEILQKYRGDACVESFDPSIVAWFRFHAPEILRGQLAMRPERYETMKPWQKQLFGNCLCNVLARPHFIAYEVGEKTFPIKLAEKMGAMRICWTSHDLRNEIVNDAVIFEYYLPTIKY